MRRVLVLGVILALLSPAYGQMGPGYGMGPGMMDWGNWTMGPGIVCGLDPEMMGGNWSGQGQFGPWMMNPQMMAMMMQMMQGGMMGGYGMGPGMMGYGGYGMKGYYHGVYKGTADAVIHYLFWVLLLAIMAAVLYLLLAKKVCHMGGRAVETLRDRYARGEINEEEYKKMKATLEGR